MNVPFGILLSKDVRMSQHKGEFSAQTMLASRQVNL